MRSSSNGSLGLLCLGAEALKSSGACRFIASSGAVVLLLKAGNEARATEEKVFAELAAGADEDGTVYWVIFDMSDT